MREQRNEVAFAFGENWSSYSATVTDHHLAMAKQGLVTLLPELASAGDQGASFIDLGCGSGIHSVAAASMGLQVTSIDIDPICVETTLRLAQQFGVESQIQAQVGSVLDTTFVESLGRFRFVYSWGVLHHTGDLWGAVESALNLANFGTDSRAAIALYRRTTTCPLWKVEKRWYAGAGPIRQGIARALFRSLLASASLFRRAPLTSPAEYVKLRGMSLEHDAHDWLGGSPYESTTRDEFIARVSNIGWDAVCVTPAPTQRAKLGILGSTCDEYVLRRQVQGLNGMQP